jgi:hypothetical protein
VNLSSSHRTSADLAAAVVAKFDAGWACWFCSGEKTRLPLINSEKQILTYTRGVTVGTEIDDADEVVVVELGVCRALITL